MIYIPQAVINQTGITEATFPCMDLMMIHPTTFTSLRMTPAYQQIVLTIFDLEKINQAVAYITEHPGRKLNSQSIAQAVNISEHKLKAGIKRKYGVPLQPFIIRARMEAATTLLQTTDLPLKTVAGNVGYKNLQYFITAYKKYYGQTPGSFRRQVIL